MPWSRSRAHYGSAAYNAEKRGQIPVLKIGRRSLVPLAALDRLLEGAGPIDGHPDRPAA